MKRAFGWSVAGWVIASAMSLPLVSQAQAHHGGGSRGAPHGGGHRGGYYGRDFHSFGHGEVQVWRGGGWRRDWHDGRFGWWWLAGGYWYLYPEPIYPYPTYVPPAVVVQQAPPVPTGLPPSQFWYYCADPQGYYPYVASCNGAWQPVPATPPGAMTDGSGSSPSPAAPR